MLVQLFWEKLQWVNGLNADLVKPVLLMAGVVMVAKCTERTIQTRIQVAAPVEARFRSRLASQWGL